MKATPLNGKHGQETGSKWKRIFQILLVYIVIFLMSTLLFILMFHIQFFHILDVFFYRGCVFLVICSLVAFALMRFAGQIFRSLHLTVKDSVMMLSFFSCITLAWFVLIPTTAERSISIFMLSYMDENSEEITVGELEDVFYNKYIQEFGALEKRFYEQEVSGNIITVSEKTDGYVITDRGRFIVDIFRLVSKLFDTEDWLVYPNEY